MASPSVNVKDGGGAYVAPTNGANVTPGNTISIQLASVSGVSSWLIACVYTDELSSAVTVTSAMVVDNLNKIATYTAPVAGRAYIFQSRINGGIDANGAVQPTLTTTFGIYTLAASGNRVVAANETVEGNPTFGWVSSINPALRTVAGGGTTPTGTGIPHVVGGVQNAAASLIVDADVSASAAVAVSKLAPGANTQVLTTTGGVTVWAAPAGGGSVPTGTGFTHITAGAQDAASKKVDLTAAADVTVPATANGVVTSSGTVLQQAANVLAGSGFVSWGAIPAGTGSLRLSTADTVVVRNFPNSADLTFLGHDSSDNLVVGSFGASQGNVIMRAPSGGAVIRNEVATNFIWTSTATTNLSGMPIIGDSGQPSPYGVHGKTTVATAPPFTLVAADYAKDAIMLSNAGAGTVTFPAATDAGAYYKTVINTGAGTKTLSNGGASTPTLATSLTGRYLFDSAGVHLTGTAVAYP